MKATFTVSGPNIEGTAPSAATGLSLACNFGSRAAKLGFEATFYVRDPAGNVRGRVESHEDGTASVFGSEFYPEQRAA